MAEYEKLGPLNRLCRIMFMNPSINKGLPDGNPLGETLLTGQEKKNKSTLHLYIRGQRTFIRIATRYFPTGKILVYSEYKEAILLDKLSDKKIKQIFTRIWDDPKIAAPHGPPFPDWMQS